LEISSPFPHSGRTGKTFFFPSFLLIGAALIYSVALLYPFSGGGLAYAQLEGQPLHPEQGGLMEGNQSGRIMLEYKNPNMGLIISYPENWDVDNLANERERSVAFFVFQGPDDLYGEYVNVFLNVSGEPEYYSSAEMSLDEISQQLVAYLGEIYNDFQHISTEPGVVAGIPAFAIHYSYSDPALGETEAMEVIMKDGDKLYDFLYSVKPNYFSTELATFRKILDSVQVLRSSSLQQEQQQQQPSPLSQQPQSQQQEEQQHQQNIGVSITPDSSSLTDTAFQPNPVQVGLGDTVTWTNDDSQPHTVTSGQNEEPDGKFDSSPNFNPLLAPAQTFEHTFTEAGQYPYFCMMHPNQVGTVIVS
jgi:plastocyanin